jgi:ureidoglycolate lyase
MRSIRVERLTLESFNPFGSFSNFTQPTGSRIGEPPIEFFRDALQQSLSQESVSYSTCRVRPRPMIVEVLEYHSRTAETMMALDNDMIVQVAPATPPTDSVPVDQLRAFHVPRGTMVMLRPGVWHHAPFSPDHSDLHVLVALPERTYANDCIVVPLEESDRVVIEMR